MSKGRGRRSIPADELGIDAVRPAADQTMHDAVYRELRRAMMAGAMQPNVPISIRSLAKRLGTGTSPVKDALRRLSADGVLHANPKSAFRISSISADRYRDLVEIRVRLESFATSVAARRSSPDLIRKLDTLNERYLRLYAKEPHAALRNNQEFHFAIYQASGMPDLVEIIASVWTRVGPYLGLSIVTLDSAEASANHRGLIESIAAGDGRSAARWLEKDLRSTVPGILAAIDSMYGAHGAQNS